MWVRTRLLSWASYYEVIKISHFKSDFAPFCTVSHRLCANLHRASLEAPFNIQRLGPYTNTIVVCCKQSLLWNSLKDNWWQTICSICNISINLPPFQQQHIWFLYSSFLQDSTAFQKQKAAAFIYCPSCCDGNPMVAHFVFKNLLNKKIWSSKTYFCFQVLCVKAQILMLWKKCL